MGGIAILRLSDRTISQKARHSVSTPPQIRVNGAPPV